MRLRDKNMTVVIRLIAKQHGPEVKISYPPVKYFISFEYVIFKFDSFRKITIRRCHQFLLGSDADTNVTTHYVRFSYYIHMCGEF